MAGSCSQGADNHPSLLVGKNGLGSPSCLRDVDSQTPSRPPSLPGFNKQIVPPSCSDKPFKKLLTTFIEVLAAGSPSHVH